MSLERELKAVYGKMAEAYNPKTAFGNERVLKILREIEKLREQQIKAKDCTLCDDDGNVDMPCDTCGGSGEVKEPCEHE